MCFGVSILYACPGKGNDCASVSGGVELNSSRPGQGGVSTSTPLAWVEGRTSPAMFEGQELGCGTVWGPRHLRALFRQFSLLSNLNSSCCGPHPAGHPGWDRFRG